MFVHDLIKIFELWVSSKIYKKSKCLHKTRRGPILDVQLNVRKERGWSEARNYFLVTKRMLECLGRFPLNFDDMFNNRQKFGEYQEAES